MNHLVRCVGVLSLVAVLSGDSPACSFCPMSGGAPRNSLGREYEQASLVVFGRLANPRFNTEPGAPVGSGATDLVVERALKNTTKTGPWKTLTIPRYLPIVDPKSPPSMIYFGDVAKGKIDLYAGRTATPALLAYLEATLPLRDASRVDALVEYAKYLTDADAGVADDAFLEFAVSKDADVGQAARRIAPELVRGIVADPNAYVEKLSLAAFLLGGRGTEQDARTLRALIDAADPQRARALDGILAGYIQLQPKEGWRLVFRLLADRKQQFQVRYAVVRTLCFYHGWQPKESHAHIVKAMSSIVADGELADLAVENLRQWQVWDLTALILSQYGKKSHDAPIIKRSLVRYALSCPLPEARTFIQRVRRADPETVADLEEYLQIERK